MRVTSYFVYRLKMVAPALVTTLFLVTSAQGFTAPAVPTVKTMASPVRPFAQPILTMLNDASNNQGQAFAVDEPSTDTIDQELAISSEETETQKLMRQVKEAGVAGVISYALWELAFWFVSVPAVFFGYYEVMGHWPDLSNSDDMAKLGAEAFAFVNFARFAVPLRIGLALSTTSWIQENVVDRFSNKQSTITTNDGQSGPLAD